VDSGPRRPLGGAQLGPMGRPHGAEPAPCRVETALDSDSSRFGIISLLRWAGSHMADVVGTCPVGFAGSGMGGSGMAGVGERP
jgi:hypothetical protein